MESVTLIIFSADDLVLVSDSVKGLQTLINKLELYCDTWKLTVNTKKSKIIVFKNGSILRNIEKWKYKNNQMQIVNSYNYLGVIFNSNGSWNKAIDHNRQKANQS